MKSNITQSPLRTYSSIPSKWPTFKGELYHTLSKERHFEDGWRDVVIPELKINQRRGDIYYDKDKDVVTYKIISITFEEIRAAQLVYDIKPSQGKILLHRMGLLDQVEGMIAQSSDVELRLFWEYALTWDLKNIYITSLSAVLGMSQTDTEDFFIAASQIN